jgi:2-oxoisovalerate dehydrogenase E1 component
MTAMAEPRSPTPAPTPAARAPSASPYGAPSAQNRVPAVDAGLLRALDRLEAEDAAGALPRPRDPGLFLDAASRLTGRLALEMLESAIASRHLDFEARAMKARGEGYYTIGSTGHEANAALAAATRPTDPALLHYRSGAFFAQRAKERPGETPTFDILLSLAASSEDPISGGRHKVFGSATLAIPPQTSTIASHIPKALGLAVGLERARALGRAAPYPGDAIVLCTMGDASVNHATAQAGFHAARWFAYQGIPAPVLFVSEDNGIGISTDTPAGWVRAAFSEGPRGPDGAPLLAFFEGDGRSLASSFAACRAAARHVRETRRPAFLRLATVRLMGHAGSDVETTYRTLAEMEAVEASDPLVAFVEEVCRAGFIRPSEVRAVYEETRERVAALAREASRRPKLESVAEITAPLAPLDEAAVMAEARRPADPAERARLFGGEANLPERSARPKHLGALVPQALLDLGARYPDLCIFGEDVAKKGGVYHATADLQKRLGALRVFDTLLDETTILALGMGLAQAGLLPSPEIQYLAYVHNALDQLRGEACSLQFFSNDRFRNPMVVRIAGLGYQKGFGGHFHNDNSTAALRDIPGLIVACPSRGDDHAMMARTLFAAARVAGRVSVLLEPIALYMQKDLFAKDDEGWCCRYPEEGRAAEIGRARCVRLRAGVAGAGAGGGGGARGSGGAGGGIGEFLEDVTDGEGAEGDALTIVTYGNGVFLSAQAARTLEAEHGVRARILDLRWLRPLDEAAILRHARATRRVLVVDEGRRSGGVAEPVLAVIAEGAPAGAVAAARVAGADTYIPLAAAALLCMPSVAEVVEAARRLVRG